MADASGPLPDFFASDDESDGARMRLQRLSRPSQSWRVPVFHRRRSSNEDPAADNPLFLPDEEDADYGDVPAERLRSVSIRPDPNPADDVDMSDVFGIHQEGGSKPALDANQKRFSNLTNGGNSLLHPI
jgi:hypothetical protein